MGTVLHAVLRFKNTFHNLRVIAGQLASNKSDKLIEVDQIQTILSNSITDYIVLIKPQTRIPYTMNTKTVTFTKGECSQYTYTRGDIPIIPVMESETSKFVAQCSNYCATKVFDY